MLETYVLERPASANQQENYRDSFSLNRLAEFFGNPTRIKWDVEHTEDYRYERSQEPSLEGLPKQGFFVLNSSGHFHHRTYFLVKHLEEDVEYIHIDAHPDLWGVGRGFDGSSFVSEILTLPQVNKVHLVGITPNETLIPPEGYNGDPKIIAEKVKLIFGEKLERLIEPVHRGEYQELYNRASKLFENSFECSEGESLSGKNIYVSIDPDVLYNFPSDWRGHGRLNMEGLIKVLDLLNSRANILAGDACGLDFNHTVQKSDLKKIQIICNHLRE